MKPIPVAVMSTHAASRSVRSSHRWATSPVPRVSAAEPSSVPVTIAPTCSGEKPERREVHREHHRHEAVGEPAERAGRDHPRDVDAGRVGQEPSTRHRAQRRPRPASPPAGRPPTFGQDCRTVRPVASPTMDSAPTSVVASARSTPTELASLVDATAARSRRGRPAATCGATTPSRPPSGPAICRTENVSACRRRRARARRRPAPRDRVGAGSAPTSPRSRTRSTTSSPAAPGSSPTRTAPRTRARPTSCHCSSRSTRAPSSPGASGSRPRSTTRCPTDDRGVVERHVTDALDWQMVELAPGDAVSSTATRPHWSGAERDRPRPGGCSWRRTRRPPRATRAPSTTRRRAAAMAASTEQDGRFRISTHADFAGEEVAPDDRADRGLHPRLTPLRGDPRLAVRTARKSRTSGSARAVLREERVAALVHAELGAGDPRPRSPRSSAAARCRRSDPRRRASARSSPARRSSTSWPARAASCSASPRCTSADFSPELARRQHLDQRRGPSRGRRASRR